MDISNVGRILSGLPLEKLTREQENDCATTIQRYATGQQRQDAIDLLVLHSMRDAFFYLRRCCRGSMIDGDLYSVCYAALSRSAVNFKPSRQSYFAFSKAYLRGQMLREFKKRKVVKRGEVLTLPSPQSIDGWAMFFFCGSRENGDWETESGVLQDLSVSPELDAINMRERMKVVAPLLKRLTASETDVLQKFFVEGRTLDEIGKLRGVTRERIRQIKAKALRKLRLALYARKQNNE